MRLFVGIPLPDEVSAEIAAVVAELRPGRENLRWAAPEGWHITLQFLGNGDTNQLECLKARLADIHSAAVPLQLGSLGTFERAGIVFVDVEVRPKLTALQQQVVAATTQCGFAPEDRPFRPHITLARTKARRKFPGLPDSHSWHEDPPRFTPFEVREFLLYESFTGEAGSRYEARARFALGI